MRVPNFRLAALALTSGLLLSGCAYGDYGYGGLGVGYGDYGYGNYGYGYPYGGYGYGYGNPYDGYGWYGDYYYPGSGYYVYDRHRHPRVWTDRERDFWTRIWRQHHDGATSTTTVATTNSVAPRENWSGFSRQRNRGSEPGVTTSSNRSDRGHWGQRSSSTTTSSSDTTTTTRSDGWRGRGHNRPND